MDLFNYLIDPIVLANNIESSFKIGRVPPAITTQTVVNIIDALMHAKGSLKLEEAVALAVKSSPDQAWLARYVVILNASRAYHKLPVDSVSTE